MNSRRASLRMPIKSLLRTFVRAWRHSAPRLAGSYLRLRRSGLQLQSRFSPAVVPIRGFLPAKGTAIAFERVRRALDGGRTWLLVGDDRADPVLQVRIAAVEEVAVADRQHDDAERQVGEPVIG